MAKKIKNLSRIDVTGRRTDLFQQLDTYCIHFQVSTDCGGTWKTIASSYVDKTLHPYGESEGIMPSCGYEVLNALEMFCDAGFQFIGFVEKSVQKRLEDGTSLFQ